MYIVKPISFGSLERFERQNNKYHIVLSGVKDGEAVEDVYKINCVNEVIDPFFAYERYNFLRQRQGLEDNSFQHYRGGYLL